MIVYYTDISCHCVLDSGLLYAFALGRILLQTIGRGPSFGFGIFTTLYVIDIAWMLH